MNRGLPTRPHRLDEEQFSFLSLIRLCSLHTSYNIKVTTRYVIKLYYSCKMPDCIAVNLDKVRKQRAKFRGLE